MLAFVNTAAEVAGFEARIQEYVSPPLPLEFVEPLPFRLTVAPTLTV